MSVCQLLSFVLELIGYVSVESGRGSQTQDKQIVGVEMVKGFRF